MSEMVDRVAKAMYDAMIARMNVKSFGWEAEDNHLRDDWRAVARVAIAEMREPTEEMTDVISHDEYDWGANNWRAMIDSALE